jgi:spore germination protein KB
MGWGDAMLEKGVISSKQFFLLVFMYILGSSVWFVPSIISAQAKQNAWISALLGMVIGVALVLFYNQFVSRFQGVSFVAFSEAVLGKWIGKFVAFCFFTYTFLLSALVVRNVGDFFSTFMMPETPIQAFHILFLLLMIMGTRLGLEVLSRSLEILSPSIIGIIFIGMVALLPQMDWRNITPLIDNFRPILRGTYVFIGSPILEIVIFLILIPYVKQSALAGKSFLIGAFLGGIALSVLVLYCILVLGNEMTARQTYASHTLIRQINLGSFRFDALFTCIAVTTSFYKAAICFYASNLLLAEVLELKDYRPLTLPLGVILIILSLLAYPNFASAQAFLTHSWTTYAMTFALFFPLLLYVSSLSSKR